MSENVPVSKDEIDLGQVLKIIGKFFEKVFNFIKDVVLFLFDLLIRLVLLIKENILKFLIVGLVCFIVGYTNDYFRMPIYSSTMIAQPNFGSTDKLYSDIKYYDGLTAVSDSLTLKEIFGIEIHEASSILSFSVQPIRDENEMLVKYDFFQSNIKDSIDTPELGYFKFKNNISPSAFINHTITVESVDPFVFKKLEEAMVRENAVSNKFIKKVKEKLITNNIIQKKSLAKQEEKIDSLSAVYRKVLLKSAEKNNSTGTNIQLASNKVQTNEMDLFKLEKQINIARQDLNSETIMKDEIINVVSGFQKRGKEVEVDFYDTSAFMFSLLGISCLFIFFFFKSLNTYLNNYKNKINA